MRDQSLADHRPIASFSRLWCYRLIMSDPIGRAQEEFFRKEATNDCNQENAFSSRLVSHSKGSLRVYFVSSASICALARAVTDEIARIMHLALESNFNRFARIALCSPNRGSSITQKGDVEMLPGPRSNCFASRLLMLSPSRIRTGLGRADDYESSSSKRDHHSCWECPGITMRNRSKK